MNLYGSRMQGRLGGRPTKKPGSIRTPKPAGSSPNVRSKGRPLQSLQSRGNLLLALSDRKAVQRMLTARQAAQAAELGAAQERMFYEGE